MINLFILYKYIYNLNYFLFVITTLSLQKDIIILIMQTFLPYADFQKSANILDKKRCWKQVVETTQILNLLNHRSNYEFYILNLKKLKKLGLLDLVNTLPMYSEIKSEYYKCIPHINHPAVKMWEGYTELLRHYYNIFLEHCIKFHKIKTKLLYYQCAYSYGSRFNSGIKLMRWDLGLDENGDFIPLPWWLDNEDFHRAMRSRLIVKDRNYYLSKFPNDENFNEGKYLWADMNTKTFKII